MQRPVFYVFYMTNSADTWQVTYLTGPHGERAGILDVNSGSQAIGSDGQRYADW